ncbi:MAG TPA: hypothetical protein VKU38_20950 [Ktedonobacteraceae bacterium]|nr:hypothetical protein [Ktedonobacteraceae bacterium]
MAFSVPVIMQEEIRTRYERKYGPVSIDFDQFTWEEDNTFTLEFTLSKNGDFIIHYYGKAAYDGNSVLLDIKAI